MVGTDAESPAEAMKFISAYGIDHELIVIACGPDGNVIRFIPPMTASMEELDAAIGVVDSALTDYEAH